MGTYVDSLDELYNLWVTRNIIEKVVQVKKIGAKIEVEYRAKGQGEGNGLPHAGQDLAKVQVLGH